MRMIATGWMLIALALTGGCGSHPGHIQQGYVEGEFIYAAAPASGRLAKLLVQRGDPVRAGDRLFELDPEPEASRLAEAGYRLDMTRARLADLRKGSRTSEIKSLQARLEEARAAMDFAAAEFRRQQAMLEDQATPERERDLAASNQARAAKQVRRLEADLQTARLGARQDLIDAAASELNAAGAVLQRARWEYEQKRVDAPEEAVVYDTLYAEGEWVAAGRPVITLLPPNRVKVRAFVAQPTAARLQVGDVATIQITPGTPGFAAKVTFVSPSAEYTPPVLYSRDNRARLVFMVELQPDAQADTPLQPGLPVDVTFGPETVTNAP